MDPNERFWGGSPFYGGFGRPFYGGFGGPFLGGVTGGFLGSMLPYGYGYPHYPYYHHPWGGCC
jgi:hypothetical protein